MFAIDYFIVKEKKKSDVLNSLIQGYALETRTSTWFWCLSLNKQ